ncbi:MAG: topoisomerase [Thaumarchaeota archaeon]|nr:MAG: topoisomerase [Nitrososphaerota archaeon]TLX82650.1 MAG: topoisomerase [Nitrososphaerota archaeon]
MNVTESEIIKIQNFIDLLNSKKDSMVVVEGKRDASALKKLGYSGKLCEFHSFKGLTKFADSIASYKNLIILFDGDRKGKYLTSKIISRLEHRIRIDLSFKRKLVTITKGKIRHIEDLSTYTRLDRFTVL